MSRRRVAAISRRIVEQFRRDHRSLALLFVAPLVITALLGWIVNEQQGVTTRVAVVNEAGPVGALVAGALQSAAAQQGNIDYAGTAETEQAGRQMIVDGTADLVVVIPPGFGPTTATLTIVTPGIDPARDGGRLAAFQRGVVAALAAALPGGSGRAISIERQTVYGSPNATQLDSIGPIFVGFFAYFFVFILTGISFLRERTGGTLERLLATPVTRTDIVVGYSLGFGFFATLQVIVILTFSLMKIPVPAIGPLPALSIGLGLASAGSPLLVFLVVLLLAIGAVNLGIFLSTYARSEFQIFQFIPLVIVPQGLLSGLFWPIDALPALLQPVARIMPLTYAVDGLRSVMIRGADLADRSLQVDVLVLAAVAIVVALLATRTIRREIV